MTDYQNAVAKMINEVLFFFKEMNSKDDDDQTILQKHVAILQGLNTDLEKFKKIQETDIKGIFTEKKNAKKELSINTYKLSGSLRSFATDNGNNLLYQEVDTSKSAINKLADLNLVSYSELVIDKLNKYKEQLVAYAISDKDIEGLTAETANFDELLLKPAKMRKEVKVATANIKALITKMLNLLSESIDNDMLQYQDKQPELYKKYLVIREIDDSQTTALSIKGKVTDAHHPDQPVEYVQVTVKFHPGPELSGNVKSAYTTTTTEKGNFQFKGLPEGACRVKFEKNNYRTLELNSEVHHDKFTKLDVLFAKEEV